MRFALVLLVACGSSPPPAQQPAPKAGDPTCPVEVPGTSVTVEDTATGGAIVFVTTGDVGELRARAGKWGGMVQTPATKSVDNIDRGARVVFAAKPEQVGALQSELRMHAQHLAGGTCQMAM